MTQELVNKLYEEYPRIFAGQINIGCNDGWYMLIHELCKMIMWHVEGVEKSAKHDAVFNTALEKAKAGDFEPYIAMHERSDQDWVENNKEKFLTLEPRTIKHIKPVVAVQIKEKFGGLRFYVDGGDDVINGFIAFAESMSFKICEQCGSTKNVGQFGKGWIKSLCIDCRRVKEASTP